MKELITMKLDNFGLRYSRADKSILLLLLSYLYVTDFNGDDMLASALWKGGISLM